MSKGRVWKYGDNVNTDVLYAGRYTYQQLDPAETARRALEDLDPSFAENVRPGDVIVAGRNFGCGSSREQAASCLRYAGVQAVIAKSFSRIYFRNAINLGLAVLQSADAPDALETGDEVEVDIASGTVSSGERVFSFFPLPASVIGIVEAGGLIEWTKKKLQASTPPEAKG
jgi:3-isopropylmalate/(R)-2-methylmalate dehydratase small subunit